MSLFPASPPTPPDGDRAVLRRRPPGVRLAETLRFLADEIEARRVGGLGEAQAAGYLAGRLGRAEQQTTILGFRSDADPRWLLAALGAGIAGLAGCALSQVGNVGPDLGQGYIVDSFMVVVLGGVGQLAGTVYAGLGLGVLNKFLEGWTGAVLAKIIVLVFIVVFIQRRPQGIFALKGRSADA